MQQTDERDARSGQRSEPGRRPARGAGSGQGTRPASGGRPGIDPRPGNAIRDRRIASGLTQREFAAAIGISLGALRDLEQGRTRSLRWPASERLAAMLGAGQDAAAGPARAGLEILGPLTVWLAGRRVALGSVRQRAVLGLLALHRGTALNRASMVDVLWGQRPPASAVTELQGYVARLRRLLGPGRGATISTEGTCYRLVAGEPQLDAAAFERLLGAAGHAADRGELAGACRRYEQALSLWRGDVLADIDLLREHPAVIALTSLRGDAVLRYAAVAQRAGAPGRALPSLRDLCARERFHEQAHAYLMIALAATGQQAAALQVYAELRDRLDEELGIRPAALLAEAHLRVLRQQTSARTGQHQPGHRPV